MNRLSVFIVVVLALSGCAVNMVKLGVYKNKAQLIGADGTVYVGSILINDISNDGDIEFEESPYGKLAGKWTATSAVVPVVRAGASDTQAAEAAVRRAYSGKSFLVANQKAVLNCDFKANIEGDGLLGSVYVIGDGICVDDQKHTIPIQFFKS